MKLYIVSVVNDGILVQCDIYDNPGTATSVAEKACRDFNIQNITSKFYSKMKGWVIGHDLNTFISIIEREFDHNPFISQFKDLITSLCKTDEDLIPIISDDPKDPALPGGFSHPDLRPLFMKDVLDGQEVKFPYELSDCQKIGLATARINKRPFFQISTKSGTSFNQKEALFEIKNKSLEGLEILDKEMDELDKIYMEVE